MRKFLLVFVITVMSGFAQAVAQAPEQSGPPKVLLIVREEIKAGMMGSHTRHSADFVSIFNQLQTPNHRIALVPVAGNENEVVYINPGNSFADIETVANATDKKMSSLNGMMKTKMDGLDKEAPAMHSAMRDIMAVYRPELSFNPGVDIATMRYFTITTIRIRPGFDGKYQDYVKGIANVARDKAKINNFHVAVYQVVTGAPNGTYMVFRPMKSLSEMDENIGAKVRAAMSEDMRKDADKAVAESVIMSESATYAFAPRMSYVDKQFAARDQGFWAPQQEMAVKPKPRKRTPKATVPPAN